MRTIGSHRFTAALVLPLIVFAAAADAPAPDEVTAGSYALRAPRIAGGASVASGGSYRATATVGQSDAQVVPAQGGGYAIEAGFYPPFSPPTPEPPPTIFANGFE